MVHKEDDENSLGSAGTSESSDSYSYLLKDIENPSNHIKEEWEAIERTLYQENGKHVTDPVLLKECKLWRETFPHIRVRGSSIEPNNNERIGIHATKSVQAVNANQVELSKLNEKREKIKKNVVSQIVERLKNKLNISEENINDYSGIYEKVNSTDNKETRKQNVMSSRTMLEKESYFERGKGKSAKSNIYKSPEVRKNNTNISTEFSGDCEVIPNPLLMDTKSSLCSGFDDDDDDYDYDYDYDKTAPKPISNLEKNEEILRSGKINFQITERSSMTRMKIDRTDSLSKIFKPFEGTKKIDRKYENLLGRILENNGLDSYVNSTRKSSKDGRNLSETSARIRGNHGRDGCNLKKNKQLPRLNNFSNNWLSRAEQNVSDPYKMRQTYIRHDEYGDLMKRNSEVQFSEFEENFYQYDEKFMEELQREMFGQVMQSGRRNFKENINLRRPQIQYGLNYNNTAKTLKSSSCGDLAKKNVRVSNSRLLKSGSETKKNESILKSGSKKKPGKNASNQNVQLPPIETSIICTEISGRPKISTRTYPKKYM